jgi:hypothetical protein
MISLQSNISRVLVDVKRTLAPEKLQEAEMRAINDTIDRAKTKATRDIKAEGYRLSASKIKERLNIRKASRRLLVGSMRAMGKGVNLIDYGARQVGKSPFVRDDSGRLKIKPGGGVSVLVKSRRKLIKHAFIANKRVYLRAEYLNRGDRAHFTSGGFAFGKGFAVNESDVRQLTGPGVPTMLANKAVMNALYTMAGPTFEARFRHHLRRALA